MMDGGRCQPSNGRRGFLQGAGQSEGIKRYGWPNKPCFDLLCFSSYFLGWDVEDVSLGWSVSGAWSGFPCSNKETRGFLN